MGDRTTHLKLAVVTEDDLLVYKRRQASFPFFYPPYRYYSGAHEHEVLEGHPWKAIPMKSHPNRAI
jgi:hypothetical protein